MKIAREVRKKAQEVEFPWLRMDDQTPEHEREYIGTLMIGLQQSENIFVLIAGLTEWLIQVAAKERLRQSQELVVATGTLDKYKLN
jgi:hypothetical protein